MLELLLAELDGRLVHGSRDEEQFEHEAIEEVQRTLPPRPKTSAWWWLLPPVAYVLQRRRNGAYRKAFMDALPAEQIEHFVRFTNKATGWLLVAGGAFLIALDETWNLCEVAHLAPWVFAILAVGALLAGFGYTVARQSRAHAMLRTKQPA